jgi:Tfp pilus assembly protein PilZ
MEQQLSCRDYHRYPCEGAAEIFQNDGRCGYGKLNGISRGGCYLETVHPMVAGTEARLRITIAGTVLEVDARVVWTTPQVGMGMHFVVDSPEEANNLAQIVDEVAEKARPTETVHAALPEPESEALWITREAAPEVLTKVIQRMNEAGVVTRQELIAMVKVSE